MIPLPLRPVVNPLRPRKRDRPQPLLRLPRLALDAGLRWERVRVLAARRSGRPPVQPARLRRARAEERESPAGLRRPLLGWGRCRRRRLLGGWPGSWELILLA